MGKLPKSLIKDFALWYSDHHIFCDAGHIRGRQSPFSHDLKKDFQSTKEIKFRILKTL